MNRIYIIIIILISGLFMHSGCGKKKINRDYIPIIKENLFKLQLAVQEKNRAKIDSLLSIKIIEKNQSSDSLLKFVYGADYKFDFVQFGNPEIVYTNEVARIDCYVMDSSSTADRPLVFFLANDDELWLFTSFEEQSKTDSLQLD